MAKVYFFEFWHCSPHLETAFELARNHLEQGDEVHFYFGGHELTYHQQIKISPQNKFVQFGLIKLPEVKGSHLIAASAFHFYPRLNLSGFPGLTTLPSITTMAELEKFEYGDHKLGLSVLSSLVSSTRNSRPDFPQYHQQILTMLREGARIYDCVRTIMENGCADLVYVFNGRFYEYRAVLDAANSLHIPIKIHERGASLKKYSLRDFMPHDRLKVQGEMITMWNEVENKLETSTIARNFFVERRNGVVQAWKSFVTHQLKNDIPELDNNKRVITYFSSSDDEFVAVGEIYKWEAWSNQFEAVLDLIDICENLADATLVIRIHPHLTEKSDYDRSLWMSLEKHSDVVLVEPESRVDSYALLDVSDVVVTAGSTMGIEAVYWGKPSITLGPSLYSMLDATYQPEGYDELATLLQATSLDVFSERALAYGYYMSTFGIDFHFYKPEGVLKGRFMDVDLMALPIFIRSVKRALDWLRLKLDF